MCGDVWMCGVRGGGPLPLLGAVSSCLCGPGVLGGPGLLCVYFHARIHILCSCTLSCSHTCLLIYTLSCTFIPTHAHTMHTLLYTHSHVCSYSCSHTCLLTYTLTRLCLPPHTCIFTRGMQHMAYSHVHIHVLTHLHACSRACPVH